MSKSSKKVKFQQMGLNSILSSAYMESVSNQSISTDVILKIGPEKYEYPCHRLVLAASSDFLASVLSTATPGTIPVILLPDMKTSVMEFMLIYLYYGEVSVPATKYPDFVDACKLLQLKDSIENNLELPETEEKAEIDIEQEQIWIPNDDMSEVESVVVESPLPKKAKKRKNKSSIYGSKDDLLDMTPELKVEAMERLIKGVRNVYESLGITITGQIEENLQKSELIVQKDKLVRGTHICGLCQPQRAHKCLLAYNLNQTKTVYFKAFRFKQHIQTQHLNLKIDRPKKRRKIK